MIRDYVFVALMLLYIVATFWCAFRLVALFFQLTEGYVNRPLRGRLPAHWDEVAA